MIKKMLLLFFIMLSVIFCVQAVLYDGGEGYIFNTNNWNVGLGTATVSNYSRIGESSIYVPAQESIYNTKLKGLNKTGTFVIHAWVNVNTTGTPYFEVLATNSSLAQCFFIDVQGSWSSSDYLSWHFYVPSDSGRGNIKNHWAHIKILVNNSARTFSLRIGENQTVNDADERKFLNDTLWGGCDKADTFNFTTTYNGVATARDFFIDHVEIGDYSIDGWNAPINTPVSSNITQPVKNQVLNSNSFQLQYNVSDNDSDTNEFRCFYSIFTSLNVPLYQNELLANCNSKSITLLDDDTYSVYINTTDGGNWSSSNLTFEMDATANPIIGGGGGGGSSVKITQCNDGIDNDEDSLIDFPYDPGCDNKDDNDETNTADKFGSANKIKCDLTIEPNTINIDDKNILQKITITNNQDGLTYLPQFLFVDGENNNIAKELYVATNPGSLIKGQGGDFGISYNRGILGQNIGSGVVTLQIGSDNCLTELVTINVNINETSGLLTFFGKDVALVDRVSVLANESILPSVSFIKNWMLTLTLFIGFGLLFFRTKGLNFSKKKGRNIILKLVLMVILSIVISILIIVLINNFFVGG